LRIFFRRRFAGPEKQRPFFIHHLSADFAEQKIPPHAAAGELIRAASNTAAGGTTCVVVFLEPAVAMANGR
jgi:hypothetical protein